jgi:hypothetical protein
VRYSCKPSPPFSQPNILDLFLACLYSSVKQVLLGIVPNVQCYVHETAMDSSHHVHRCTLIQFSVSSHIKNQDVLRAWFLAVGDKFLFLFAL